MITANPCTGIRVRSVNRPHAMIGIIQEIDFSEDASFLYAPKSIGAGI
jgi:hypothetical protein